MVRRKVEYRWDAESIRALRKHMGLTQQQMSEELGTRQQTISEWETGMYRPRGGINRLLTIVAEQVGFEYSTSAEALSSDDEAEDGEEEEEAPGDVEDTEEEQSAQMPES